MNVPMPSSDSLFEVALHTVHSALSDADQRRFKRFSNHHDMLADLRREVCRYTGNSGKLLRCMQQVASFANAFAPFFDVISVFVQIKPEYAAVFWGSIWFIFKIGSNLVSFLERISGMLDELSFTMPQYRAWFEICQESRFQLDGSRLSQAMAFIYYDLIEFCMHIYFMFSKRNIGRIKRALLGAELLLRPFESRFTRLKERLDLHREWFETEAKIQQHANVVNTYDSFRQYVGDLEQCKEEQNQRNQAKQAADDANQVRLLKKWLDGPDYATMYEGIAGRLFPGTGQWFLQRPEYMEIKSGILSDDNVSGENDHNGWLKRVLFLRAKPGFGKTFLSVNIINDLVESLPEPHVAFFHFSQLNRTTAQTADSAFRAIATQLVHNRRRDRIALDVLALIEADSGSGQQLASPNDVKAVIDILLRQNPAVIVIDGVDECDEPNRLLEYVRIVCIEHNCRVILLGRPNVRIPHQWTLYDGQVGNVDLVADLITDDLKLYLEEKLASIAKRRLFGSDVRIADDLRQTVAVLANQAEGLFLWVQLLVNLLESPALTPADRIHTLKSPGYLYGLDSLYERTLDVLRQQMPEEVQVAQTLFQWISCSAMPLSKAAFHTVLAITPGRPTEENDYLPDYPDCIPLITCALVEVQPSQDTFSFIHITFKEFLLSTSPRSSAASRIRRPLSASALGPHNEDSNDDESQGISRNLFTLNLGSQPYIEGSRRQDNSTQRPWATISEEHSLRSKQYHKHNGAEFKILNIKTVHATMAETCISHLVLDIPARPLTESKTRRLTNGPFSFMEEVNNSHIATIEDELRIVSDVHRERLDKKYPFLRYSTLCWDHHLIQVNKSMENNISNAPFPLESPPPWVILLSRFMLNRLSVTAWVEAAYIYRRVPRLGHLLDCLGFLQPGHQVQPVLTTVQVRECWWTYTGLQQLTKALDYLQQHHEEGLLVTPYKIWHEEIVKSEDGEFWPVWKEEKHPRTRTVTEDFDAWTAWRLSRNVDPSSAS